MSNRIKYDTLGTMTPTPKAPIQILKKPASEEAAEKNYTLNPSGNKPSGWGYWDISKAYPECVAQPYGQRSCA